MNNDKILLADMILDLIDGEIAERCRAAMIKAEQAQFIQRMTALTVQVLANGGDNQGSLAQELTARLREIMTADGHCAEAQALAPSFVGALMQSARNTLDAGGGTSRRPGTTIRCGQADRA